MRSTTRAGHTVAMLPFPSDAAPDESRAPDGTLWWELKVWPSTKRTFGGEPRICAWLWFNKEVGDTFTMRELREELGGDIAENAEHFNRRLRTLRACGWQIPTNRDDPSIPRNSYRLDRKGRRIWLKGESRDRNAVSAKARRQVFERDGYRCVVCGTGSGESYPGEPGTKARLTIGHRVPQERLRGRGIQDDIDNLRTECSRCNEPVRDVMPDPERYDEVLAEVRGLKAADRRLLLVWLTREERSRSSLDQAYDRARKLSHSERERLKDFLQSQLR